MKVAICKSVPENIDIVKDDGFALSLKGNQEIRFFRLPILTPAEDEIEQAVEIKSVEGTNAS